MITSIDIIVTPKGRYLAELFSVLNRDYVNI
jgi:hypothetical protein